MTLDGTTKFHIVNTSGDWGLATSSLSGNNCIILTGNFNITNIATFSGATTNVTIIGNNKTITHTGSSFCFYITSASSVTIKDVHLRSNSGYGAQLVNLNGGGVTFTMQGNSSISGNSGPGVFLHTPLDKFIMDGGTISDNGGTGVVLSSGIFYMNGGTISGNRSGGVDVTSNSTFYMNGGTISGNSAIYGGGVHVDGATIIGVPANFIMSGGTISGNTATSGFGHSLYVNIAGTYTVQYGSGETIGLTSTTDGGGATHQYVNTALTGKK